MGTKIENLRDVKEKSESTKIAAKKAREWFESSRDRIVGEHVLQTNLAIEDTKQAQLRLFDVVKDAYLELKDDVKGLNKYKTLVNIDRSSINKIIQIVENDTLMKLRKQLPISWGTLYAVSRMEADQIADAVDSKKIDCDSTLVEVNQVRDLYIGKQSSDGEKKKAPKKSNEIEVNTCWVDLEELPNLSKKDTNSLIGLLGELMNFGIQVTGVDLVDRKAA